MADVYVFMVPREPVRLVDRTREIADGVLVDLDETGTVVGVEILGALVVTIDGKETHD